MEKLSATPVAEDSHHKEDVSIAGTLRPLFENYLKDHHIEKEKAFLNKEFLDFYVEQKRKYAQLAAKCADILKERELTEDVLKELEINLQVADVAPESTQDFISHIRDEIRKSEQVLKGTENLSQKEASKIAIERLGLESSDRSIVIRYGIGVLIVCFESDKKGMGIEETESVFGGEISGKFQEPSDTMPGCIFLIISEEKREKMFEYFADLTNEYANSILYGDLEKLEFLEPTDDELTPNLRKLIKHYSDTKEEYEDPNQDTFEDILELIDKRYSFSVFILKEIDIGQLPMRLPDEEEGKNGEYEDMKVPLQETLRHEYQHQVNNATYFIAGEIGERRRNDVSTYEGLSEELLWVLKDEIIARCLGDFDSSSEDMEDAIRSEYLPNYLAELRKITKNKNKLQSFEKDCDEMIRIGKRIPTLPQPETAYLFNNEHPRIWKVLDRYLK